MNSIFFECPVCGCKNKNVILEDEFSIGDLIECPECFNIIMVGKNHSLEDFKDILLEMSSKRRAESKLNEPDMVCIKSLEDV